MEFDDSLAWRELKGGGFNAHIGPVRIARINDTEWNAALALDERHMNSGGVCHGGVLLTFADCAMGTATFEAGGGHPCATIEMQSQFLAAAKNRQMLLARVIQLRHVKTLSFMRAELWSGGRQVLSASGIWKYLDSRRPG